MSILQLKNITVIYGNPPLLDGVELVVQPKERVCLVGRNGSGKSTLLNSLLKKVAFKNGFSTGKGMTYKFDFRVDGETIYMDTPGLFDVKMSDFSIIRYL